MDEQLSDRKAIIARYAAGPNQLETAIAGLSEGELDIAESDGTWTIRQIVHHIADGDDIWKVFIKRAIGNPGGKFDLQWYWAMPQDEWVKSWAYASREMDRRWRYSVPVAVILCNCWSVCRKSGSKAYLSHGRTRRNRKSRWPG
jgi:hypothetical protein